jgi:hypothetical protein
MTKHQAITPLTPLLTLLLAVLTAFALSACAELKDISRSFNQIAGDVSVITDSTSTFSERLARGAGTGLVGSLTTPESRRRLDSLTAQLVTTLRDTVLSEATERRTTALVQGILTTVLNDKKFNHFLDSVSGGVRRNLRLITRDLGRDLGYSLRTEVLGKQTGAVLRERITQDILGDATNQRLRVLLHTALDSTLRPSLDSLTASLLVQAASGVNGPLRGAVDGLIKQQTAQLNTELAQAKRTLTQALIGSAVALALLAAGLMWFWWRQKIAYNVSKTLTFQIEKFGSKDLKNAIQEAAHQRRVDSDLDDILTEQGLLRKSNTASTKAP